MSEIEILDRLAREGKTQKSEDIKPDGVRLVGYDTPIEELAKLSPEEKVALQIDDDTINKLLTLGRAAEAGISSDAIVHMAWQLGIVPPASAPPMRRAKDVADEMKAAGWQSATAADIIKLSTEDRERFGVNDALVERMTHVAKVTGLI